MAGTYTEITEILAPSQATIGDTVTVTAKAKNIYSAQIHMYIIGVVTSSDGSYVRFIDWVDAWVNPGVVFQASGQFLTGGTPGSLTINIRTWYEGLDGAAYSDDSASRILEVVGAQPPTAEGVINKKELEYDSARATIPASNIPKGKNAKAHIWGKNLMATYQIVGMSWIITDPVDIPVETHADDWALGLVGTNQDREFVSYSAFNLSKVGTYMIAISMYINSSNPVVVDTYTGILCVVTEAAPPPPTARTLEVDITPAGTGTVTTNPASIEGKAIWNNGDTGTFPDGTNVQVTAVPASGYAFDHWSDKIVGGTSTANPAMVQTMTEHRAVKAHFISIDMKVLEVDITPAGRGYVITDKASKDGRTEWRAGDTGQYPKGTVIQVTAFPYTGYEFDHWSDQIEGGVSYENPAFVKPMSENRSVKLHLKEVAGDGAAGATFKSLKIDGWGSSPTSLGTSPVEIAAGGKLYVKFTLGYTAVQAGSTELWVSLVRDPGRDRTWKFKVPLEVGTDLTFTDTLAIPILSTESTLDNETYDLWVEINNVIDDKATGAVTLTGMPKGMIGQIGEMIGLLVVVVMVMMMMEMMGPMIAPAGTPPQPKPVTEAVVKGVKGAAKYAGQAIKKVTEYYEHRGEED